MKLNVITRREFLKFVMGGAAAVGISQVPFAKDLLNDKSRATNPYVVWIQGQDCAGCTESVISALEPGLDTFLLDTVTVRFHPTIMAGTGQTAINALAQIVLNETGYILVVEGAIPDLDKRYLHVADIAFEDIFVASAKNAAAIIALGACASFGGIPAMGVTNAKGMDYFLTKHALTKPLINLPGCPVNPVWFYDTVLDYLAGLPLDLDSDKRPLKHFRKTVHSQCERLSAYQAGNFLNDWNDETQKDYCLANVGCLGWKARADCPVVKWNEGANWCVGNSAPCINCTGSDFFSGHGRVFNAVSRQEIELFEEGVK